MARSPKRLPLTPESAREVDERFYRALSQRDLAQLMSCWSDDDEVVCIHPGVARMVGGASIKATYEQLFEHAEWVAQEPVHRQVIQSLGMEIHSVVQLLTWPTEEGEQSLCVAATNVYQRVHQGWRLVFRQVSPADIDELQGQEQRIVH